MNRPHRLSRFALLALIALGISTAWSCMRPVDPQTAQLEIAPAEIRDAAVGEAGILLVWLTAASMAVDPNRSYPVIVACDGAQPRMVPATLTLGEVAEIHLVPDSSSAGDTIDVTIASHASISPVVAQLHVTEPIALREELVRDASHVRDRFIPWIEEDHPELGISDTTVWTAVPVRTHRLVVMHCLFLSENWEMAVWWHVTTPPHDWARMYLRRRFHEPSPSWAAEIHSLLEDAAPAALHFTPELIR